MYEYYNHTVQRSEEYKERKLRRSQLTISQKDRNSFFKDKIIDSVKINPIKEGGVVKTARVIFDIKNGKVS